MAQNRNFKCAQSTIEESLKRKPVRYVSVRGLLAGLMLGTICHGQVVLGGDEPEDGAQYPPALQTGSRIEPIDELDNDPSVLSRLKLEGPALLCGEALHVSGYIPEAILRIRSADGSELGRSSSVDTSGHMVRLDAPLDTPGMELYATQEINGTESAPSNRLRVVEHTDYYPDGQLPRPEFNHVPLYRCGIASIVDNLPQGGSVQAFTDVDPGTPLADVSGVGKYQIVSIDPPFVERHNITAISSICGIPSEASSPAQPVQPAPDTVSKPDDPVIYGEGQVIGISGVVNGALVTVSDGASGDPLAIVGAPLGQFNLRLSERVRDGQQIDITQKICEAENKTTITVQPCSALPAPIAIAPAAGDRELHIVSAAPGARITVYADGVEIGDGGGSVIGVEPVPAGAQLAVVQRLGGCQSGSAHIIPVGAGLEDPGESGRCNVEQLSYGDGDSDPTLDVTAFFNSPDRAFVAESMDSVPIRGRMYFPTGSGRFPLFVIVHGNSDPRLSNEEGYDYLLEHLASHCIIAASIDESFLNGTVEGEMDARAIVMLRHLQEMRSWGRDPETPPVC